MEEGKEMLYEVSTLSELEINILCYGTVAVLIYILYVAGR